MLCRWMRSWWQYSNLVYLSLCLFVTSRTCLIHQPIAVLYHQINKQSRAGSRGETSLIFTFTQSRSFLKRFDREWRTAHYYYIVFVCWCLPVSAVMITTRPSLPPAPTTRERGDQRRQRVNNHCLTGWTRARQSWVRPCCWSRTRGWPRTSSSSLETAWVWPPTRRGGFSRVRAGAGTGWALSCPGISFLT